MTNEVRKKLEIDPALVQNKLTIWQKHSLEEAIVPDRVLVIKGNRNSLASILHSSIRL